ncbi:MAG: cation:proton antiporter, partial [Candidatus Nanohaloarchaeota archaeon QJJ-9]|nr:cation:proton antiporter [Candidatus Nanohaloarchaeota archaeon QJJ-9]
KILSDKDEISTLPGRLNVGMLLIEDIVVVILIAIVSTGSTTITNAIYSLGEVLGVVLGLGILSFAFSKYALPKIFKEVSSNPHSFFIHGLAWAFLLIAVSSRLGISIEIGAFIAGLSLGQIPYSEELQERIRPLSDFFMAIFFINVGLTLGAKSLTAMWKEALVASMVVMVAKFFTIFFLTDWFKFSPETSFKTSINKTQISEFALIFGMMGVSHGVISRDIVAFLSIVAIITMGASSYLLRYNNEIYIEIQHLLQRFESEEKGKEIMEDLKDHAVILGYNDTVKTVLPAVKGEYKEVVLVDRNSKNTQELRDKEVEYIYGDFKHGNIRQSCKLKNAAFILSVVPDIEAQHHLLEEAPEEAIKFLEAESFENAAGFYERGADFVMIENLITAEKMKDYLQMYLEDPGVFQEEVEEDLEAIYWGGRSV